jgi:hypothetical protein
MESRKGDLLLPIRVVKSLYRGKLQAWIKEAIRTGELIEHLRTGTPENYLIYNWKKRQLQKLNNHLRLKKRI